MTAYFSWRNLLYLLVLLGLLWYLFTHQEDASRLVWNLKRQLRDIL